MITNLAAGMDDRPFTHAQTLEVAARAAEDMQRLLVGVLGGLAGDG